MKKYILAILIIALFVAIAYAANVKNYFIQPGKDGDNALYITGTENVSGTLNITGILNASSATTSFGSITASTATITNTLTASTGTFSGSIAATTLNTGQGAYELYAMNQDVQTTNAVSFSSATITNTASVKVINFAVNLDTTTAPSSTGIVGLTSGFKMYVSTGTAAGSWQIVGSQS